MKVIYIDIIGGISGDMFNAALLDLGVSISYLKKELQKFKVKDFAISSRMISKNSIKAKKFTVKSTRKGHYSALQIEKIITQAKINDSARASMLNILKILVQAEAKVHNIPEKDVHFHELGGIDTIIDIASAVLGLKYLGVEKIFCSSIPLHRGLIKTEHGILPAPAPAVMEILNGIPVQFTEFEGENITPTGAALIKGLCSDFDIPQFDVCKIGYGAGTREFKNTPNLVRFILGNLIYSEKETVIQVETNIDNTTGEVLGYVMERLFKIGAFDVFFTPIYMKKNRPAYKLTVLCDSKLLPEVKEVIFSETGTIGIRMSVMGRHCLPRESKRTKTKYGEVRVKKSAYRNSFEYEDLKKIAERRNIPLCDLIEKLKDFRQD